MRREADALTASAGGSRAGGFHLDLRTKLLLMSIVATAELMYTHTAFMLAVAAIPFVLLLANGQVRTAVVFGVLFLVAVQVRGMHGSLRLPMVANMVVVLLNGLVLELSPAFAMGSYVINSTTAGECVTSLGRMHVGRQVTIPLSVLFRFIPTMREESMAIRDAMRMREIQFGTRRFWRDPAALIEYRFVPLIISVVRIGEDLSAAALTRGLDNPADRTSITRVGFTAYDVVALVICGALLSFTLCVFR